MSAKITDILGIQGKVDKKSADSLALALKEAESNGFDYLKFRQSITAMAQMEIAEETSFKSAYATAKTMGVTKAGLAKSAKHYLSVLMSEKGKFDKALNKRVEEHIASKSTEVLTLQKQIDVMREKIAELEAKITQFEQKIESADEDVEAEKRKIKETQEKFEGTFNSFVSTIEADLELISKYL